MLRSVVTRGEAAHCSQTLVRQLVGPPAQVSLRQMVQAAARMGGALVPLTALFALSRMERDMASLLTHRLLSLDQATAVGDASRTLCAQLSAVANELVDAFGIPDHLVAAPIAADWRAFNEGDNQGEVCVTRPAWLSPAAMRKRCES